MRRPLNTVWKIPKHLTSHTRAYAYFSNILFNLDNIFSFVRSATMHYVRLSFSVLLDAWGPEEQRLCGDQETKLACFQS